MEFDKDFSQCITSKITPDEIVYLDPFKSATYVLMRDSKLDEYYAMSFKHIKKIEFKSCQHEEVSMFKYEKNMTNIGFYKERIKIDE